MDMIPLVGIPTGKNSGAARQIYGNFQPGDNNIDISVLPNRTSLLIVATFHGAASYGIRKETSSTFCLPLDTNAEFTVTVQDANTLKLTCNEEYGGSYILFYG